MMTEALVPVKAQMKEPNNITSNPDPQASRQPSPQELEAARELVRQARDRGVALTGPDGLLKALTRTVIETALDVRAPSGGEIAEHVGYDRHAVEGRNRGNSRNGRRSKKDGVDRRLW